MQLRLTATSSAFFGPYYYYGLRARGSAGGAAA